MAAPHRSFLTPYSQMCGIVACFATHSALPSTMVEVHGQLEASIKSIQHRGPDSSGTYVSPDGRVGLGHVRLSIIGLDNGHQPLHDETDTVHAIVNGELYDYANIRAELEAKGRQFMTDSDSELVVQLYVQYGVNLLSYLRGEFAFVLYDSRRDFLFAAVDRFRIKPLHITMYEDRLLLASEMKAFLGLGWKPEWDIQSIVEMGFANDNRTVFKGVTKIPPGHCLTCRSSGYMKIEPYWEHTYPDINCVETRTIDEMIQGVRDLVVDAVRLRLRSDVPLGIFLSGGIDSSAAAGIASALLKEKDSNAKLAVFTLGFPESVNHDEGPIALRFAEHLGAKMHLVQPTESDMIEVFEDVLFHIEQPFGSLHPLGRYLLSRAAKKQGYTVMLEGEGSDEIFGGYIWEKFNFLRAVDPSAVQLSIPLPTSDELEAILKAIEAKDFPEAHLGLTTSSYTDFAKSRQMLGNICPHSIWTSTALRPETFTPTVQTWFNAREIDHTQLIAENIRPLIRQKAALKLIHPLNTSLFTTSNTLLSNQLIPALGDRVQLAHALEGRHPLMDHKLVEYVNGLPPSLKVMPVLEPELSSDGPADTKKRRWKFIEKWIFREAVRPYVTEELYLRPKVAYNAPIPPSTSRALTPLQEYIKRKLTKEAIDKLGWANYDYLKGLADAYLAEPEYPADGMLDRRAQVIVFVLSFIVIQEKFGVPTAVFRLQCV